MTSARRKLRRRSMSAPTRPCPETGGLRPGGRRAGVDAVRRAAARRALRPLVRGSDVAAGDELARLERAEVALDHARALPALVDRPHDERLAAARVAGGEHA